MKVRFMALVTGLVLIIASLIVIFLIGKHNASEQIKPDNATPIPTVSTLPTATPIPVVGAEEDPGLYPAYQTTNKDVTYGYIDSSGKYVINPAFTIAGDFHEGHAVVYMGNQYLLIDKSGNIVYSSNYEIGDFKNGSSVIAKSSGDTVLFGYVNAEGKELIQPQYRYAGNFSKDQTAYVYNGKGTYAKINQTGKVLETFELNQKYNPVDIEDGFIIYYNDKSSHYGVVNSKGDVVFKANYSEITYLGDHLFALKKPDDKFFGMTSAIGAALFNADGTQLTDYTLYDISDFHNGYASVTNRSETYFIDTDGKEAAQLPKFKGRGTVVLYGDIVKAQIDHDLSYCKPDGSVIWQNETTQKLADNITVKQIKFKPNKYVSVYYPELSGLTDTTVQKNINAELKKIFVNSRSALKEKDMLTVDDSFKASIMKNLLVIEKTGYDFNFGAAHGMPIMDYYFIDITNGTFYQFKDLFIENSDYASVINQFIVDQIASESVTDSGKYFPDSFKGITDKPYFKLTDKSLIIYFYPYEIGPYAAGFIQFEIPFEDIYDYINLQGPFWNAFH